MNKRKFTDEQVRDMRVMAEKTSPAWRGRLDGTTNYCLCLLLNHYWNASPAGKWR